MHFASNSIKATTGTHIMKTLLKVFTKEFFLGFDFFKSLHLEMFQPFSDLISIE